MSKKRKKRKAQAELHAIWSRVRTHEKKSADLLARWWKLEFKTNGNKGGE